ncbi:MAG: glycosyltransferase family protein [Kofleriaceae bacterium]
MTTAVIVQARMGSTRLPGKVLASIAGAPMLVRVVERAGKIAGVDELVVATSSSSIDDPIAELADARGWRLTRGSEHDVLARYLEAARAVDASVIVRVTADCPLLDPGVGGRVVAALDGGRAADYASNTQVRTYPRGLDVEALTREALERSARDARAPAAREHVTWHVYQHPEAFRLLDVTSPDDRSALRWTVDTPADLELARRLYAAVGTTDFTYADALAAWDRDPTLADVNAHVAQKAT